MACGMKNAQFQSKKAWADVKQMNTQELGKSLQGTVDVEAIVKKLEFRGVPAEKQEWVKNWIKNADESMRGRFLHALTGSSGLGRKSLVMANSTENMVFHTCFNILDFPFTSMNSEQQFKAFFEAAVKGKTDFNIG
jgi:hypothetical protein